MNSFYLLLLDYVLVCIKSKNSSREKLEELHELQRQKFLKVLTDKHGLQIDKVKNKWH